MIVHYLKSSLRHLVSRPGLTAISVGGLGFSMAVGLLLVFFVYDQGRKDAFHYKSDKIVRVYSDFKSEINRDNALYATSPATLGTILADEHAAVAGTLHIRDGFSGQVLVGNSTLPVVGFYAEPSFFDLFSFGLVSGSPEEALRQPGSIVLTPSEAVRLLGRVNVVGETLAMQDGSVFTVTGIFERDDYHTQLPLRAVVSMATLEADPDQLAILSDWTRSIYRSYTYVELHDGVSANQFASSLKPYADLYFAERDGNRLVALHVQPITRINLGAFLGNEIGFSFPLIFAGVLLSLGLLLLLTASFNHVGLTVARALNRAREVGVRKVFGARRPHVLAQFLTESALVTGLSSILAFILLFWMVPAFNDLAFMARTGNTLRVDPSSDPILAVLFLAFVVVMTILAGFYPAVYLSRFEPASAVKGLFAGRGGNKLRKVLVVAQFAVSTIFIIFVIVLLGQAQHLKSLDYGMRTQTVLAVELQDAEPGRLRESYASLAGVQDVGLTNHLPAMGSREDAFVWTAGGEQPTKAYMYAGTENVPVILGVPVIAGRSLVVDDTFPESRNVLVNQTFVRLLGLGSDADAVGQAVRYTDSLDVHIVGVVRDYRTNPAHEAHAPILLSVHPDRARWVLLKTESRADAVDMTTVEAVWKQAGSLRPMQATPLSKLLAESFTNELMENLVQVIGMVTLISILISCLGLVGMGLLESRRRQREVAVRRVLGAGSAQLVRLLSGDFVRLLLVSLVFSLPFGWMFSRMLLSQYAERISPGIWPFATGVALMLALAIISVGYNVWKTANADPAAFLAER